VWEKKEGFGIAERKDKQLTRGEKEKRKFYYGEGVNKLERKTNEDIHYKKKGGFTLWNQRRERESRYVWLWWMVFL